MQVQLNTDDHVQGEESLAAWAEGELTEKLKRFRDHLTRVEIHLSDASAAREGAADKRCKLEARLAGMQPIVVSHDAAKVAEAFLGAVGKLQHALDTAVGRARDAHGRESIRGAAEGPAG
ncbi:HPF/RaiA family ribosome-associated protein [Aquincola sp. MAHUQ-54]|uniref:HPF/RaiA family ribosome-associated protein n=1 Tax=Aquincola agrisoli TaxID=3119538 RepID=A0AAW9QFR1_9BURK